MTQEVTLPGGDVLAFPDDMAPATMQALVQRHVATQAVTPMQDIKNAAPYSVPKALVGIAGLPGDVADMAAAAKKKLLSWAPDWVGQADSAVNRVLPPNPLNMIAPALPRSAPLRNAAEQVTGPWYDPVTRAGKVADTGIQTATTMGRNWITNPAMAGLLTGGITAGTEAAGAMTNDNPWARLAGGLLGGGGPAALNAMRSKPGAIVKDAVGDLTPAQIQEAIAMQEASKRLGVPLMGTESLDRGHQLASAVYAHPSGNQNIDNFLRQRSAQVGPAVDSNIIAQTGPRDIPQNNAARAQAAAEASISGLERDRTNLVAPDYFRAQRETLPQSAVDAVRAQAQGQQAMAPPSQAGQFTPFITDLSAPNAANAALLDSVYKRARDAANLPIGASTADKEAASAARVLAPSLEKLTQQSPNLARGRQQYQDFTRTQIEPVTSGPVGVVAGKAGYDPAAPSPVPRVTSTVADTNTVRPDTIRELYTHLNGQDPQAFPGIVQTHLENQLNNALGDIRTGPNPTSGAKFRQAVAGTPQDRANFDEMMRGVAKAHGAPPDEVVKGANTLLDILDRTGRTPGIGSPTSTRGQVNEQMSRTMLGDTLSTISLNPLRPAARRFDEWIQRGRYAGLSEALTAPDSVQQLVKLAKIKPDSLSASYYAASLLGLDKAIGSGQ
jgi:hypothetical protein